MDRSEIPREKLTHKKKEGDRTEEFDRVEGWWSGGQWALPCAREGCNPDAAKTEELTTQSATYLSNPYGATDTNYHIIRHFLTRLKPPD